MGATIRSIHIENFRSIRLLDADLSDLAIFVGRNDCGKSNILRALNLFFNEETNPGAEFDFAEDYNLYGPVRVRKAKEIVVRLEIALPESYRGTNGDFVVWTKRWREDGQWGKGNDYHGVRLAEGRGGVVTREVVAIPDKSNVHALLRKIDFEYVPAVKDSDYFDDLRGRIFGIISEVAARTFQESSTAFERAIGEHLDDLTANISSSLGLDTRLALPRDLYHIFERLDFLSGEKSVSLSNRGDGIKARHIPLILRFMAEKKAALQRRGGPPISSIWAYEEPENNLELASAVQLADELDGVSSSGTAQVILTTHSPAFYDLGQREEEVALNFVVRETDAEGTVTKADPSDIDESLGTLAMLAPRIAEMVAQVRAQEAARAEAERMAAESCPRIFVEGESDKIVLDRALGLFFPAEVGRVAFETKREGGGHGYVVDMLVAWRAHHKHHPERPKAVGIVDGDAAADKRAFNGQPDNVRSAKCLCYPNSVAVRSALARGFQVPATLETLYPLAVWEGELGRGKLVDRDPDGVFPRDLINRIVRGEARTEDMFDGDWQLLVTHDFASGRKIKAARRLCRQEDADCRVTLADFEGILAEALAYLGLVA